MSQSCLTPDVTAYHDYLHITQIQKQEALAKGIGAVFTCLLLC